MLREDAVLARKIIDFYSGRGVECAVVDEHSSLLVMLYSETGTHEFRCGRRVLAGGRWGRVCRDLEREFGVLRERWRAGGGA